MAELRQRFRHVLLLGAVLWLGACAPEPRPPALVEVDGEAIPQVQVMERMRDLLWRKGLHWEEVSEIARASLRRQALNDVVDDYLLLKAAPPADAALQQEGEDRFQQFLKQFDPPDAWKERAEGQGDKEVQLVHQFTDEARRLQTLESALAPVGNVDAALEKTARAWYDEHRAALTIPESVLASHWFLMRRDYDSVTRQEVEKPSREAELQSVLERYQRHEGTFAELANKYSEDDRTKLVGGDLGWFSRARVPADFGDVVFKLKAGEVSAPFLTKLGWHVVWVREKRPVRIPAFEEVKAEIAAMLETQSREKAVAQRMAGLRAKAKITMDEAWLARLEPAPF